MPFAARFRAMFSKRFAFQTGPRYRFFVISDLARFTSGRW